MTEKRYFVTHSGGCCLCGSISRELEDGSFEELSYDDIVNRLNNLDEENREKNEELKQFKQKVSECIEKENKKSEEEYNHVDTAMYHARKQLLQDLKRELKE